MRYEELKQHNKVLYAKIIATLEGAVPKEQQKIISKQAVPYFGVVCTELMEADAGANRMDMDNLAIYSQLMFGIGYLLGKGELPEPDWNIRELWDISEEDEEEKLAAPYFDEPFRDSNVGFGGSLDELLGSILGQQRTEAEHPDEPDDLGLRGLFS